MIDAINEKPCLVETGQGFSVVYKGRYLYSKYTPEKAIFSILSSFKILPGTLILACSPCLLLGLQQFCAQLPDDCFVLGCEKDYALFEFANERAAIHIHDRDDKQPVSSTMTDCDAANVHNTQSAITNFAMLAPDELDNLPIMLLKRTAILACGTALPRPGTFRRVIRIDFSAGTQFFPQYYERLVQAAEDAVARFWKNRVTLVKLGRKFSRNLFRNMARLPESVPLPIFFHTIKKPIIVFGAGESLEATARALLKPCVQGKSDNQSTLVREQFYVIAADTAFSPLCTLGITPDAIVCEEAQTVIAHAFFGAAQKKVRVFTGITSWHKTYDTSGGTISYFATQYDDTLFFDGLVHRALLPPVMPPLGSVGLTAMNIALFLRHNERIPIFASGLDFSYSLGTTHARGAPAHVTRLLHTTRIAPVAQYDAAFGYGAQRAQGKDGTGVFTTPALLSYARTFRAFFADAHNVYDAGKSGLALGIEQYDIDAYVQNASTGDNTLTNERTQSSTTSNKKAQHIAQFYDEEERALIELKELLQHGHHLDENERNKKIINLLKCREYVYLHFPDGWKLSLEKSFLTRVRAEIDFFIKDIRIARCLLRKE